MTVHSRKHPRHQIMAGSSSSTGRKQKKVFEITGLETLQQHDEKNHIQGQKQNHFTRNKQQLPNGKHTPPDNFLSTLPFVGQHMGDDELRRELILRNSAAATGAFSGSRQWLLDQLGETISIVKAREIVSDDVLNKLDRVSSLMTVEQLRREFVYRHPSKKKIARGKWKTWLLLQLHEGSICLAREESKEFHDFSKRPESPQESMTITVSTVPTLFSASAASTTASVVVYKPADVDDRMHVEETRQQEGEGNAPLTLVAKPRYFNSSKTGRKPSQEYAISQSLREELDPRETMPQTNSHSSRTRKAKMKQKYFQASKKTRNNVKIDGSEKTDGLSRDSLAACTSKKDKNVDIMASKKKREGSKKDEMLSTLQASSNKTDRSMLVARNVKFTGSKKYMVVSTLKASNRQNADTGKMTPSRERPSEQTIETPQNSPPPKFASTKWLSDVKAARKLFRRSIGTKE